MELSAQLKTELLPILIFFGMFFLVFGLSGIIIRRVPRKPGSMLDEVLREEWDDADEEQDEAEFMPDNEPLEEQEAEDEGE